MARLTTHTTATVLALLAGALVACDGDRGDAGASGPSRPPVPAIAPTEQSPELDVAAAAAELANADPLREGSTSPLLRDDAAAHAALLALVQDENAPARVQDRALRLWIAWNRVERVRESAGAGADHVVTWLALDELDLGLPSGPRETLLAHAIPDDARRDETLQTLAAARETAQRFCTHWNEIQRDDTQAQRNAELRAELERAGNAAVPYLARVLAIPPQATFTNIHDERGTTARRQVRALWGVRILGARTLTPHVRYHVRGPSFTQSTTALSALEELAGIEFSADTDEAARSAIVDEHWKPVWTTSWGHDHLVRHALRWAREEITSGDAGRAHYAHAAIRQLEPIVGPLEFDTDAPLAERIARIEELDRRAMRACPACIR